MSCQRQKPLKSIAAGLILLALSSCGPDSTSLEVAPRHDKYLYVASDGYSGDSGAAEFPLSYPIKAIAKALAEGYQGVKIAQGDYFFSLGSSELALYGGLDIVGGCDRSTWEPVVGRYSTLYASGSAIEGLSIRMPTLIRGLEFIGIEARNNRPTSTTVYLEGCSSDLRFEHCRFVAQDGLDIPPRTRDTLTPPAAVPPEAGGDGSCTAALDVAGGQPGSDGIQGGWGGRGGPPNSSGEDGAEASWYSLGPAVGGAGGSMGQAGQPGTDGTDGTDRPGGTALPGLGRLDSHYLLPGQGNRSSSARSGTGGGGGGGGGGSATGTGNGGGGGGTGGQSGRSADGGKGGGHSIAVITINCAAVFRSCEFVTGPGGQGQDGADGAPGAAGTPGAPGGSSCVPEVGAGGNGGRGGNGGASGGGAGGNGGSCIGLLELGTIQADVDSSCIFVTGVPGDPGLGGRHGRDQIRAESGFPGDAMGHLVMPPLGFNLPFAVPSD